MPNHGAMLLRAGGATGGCVQSVIIGLIIFGVLSASLLQAEGETGGRGQSVILGLIIFGASSASLK